MGDLHLCKDTIDSGKETRYRHGNVFSLSVISRILTSLILHKLQLHTWIVCLAGLPTPLLSSNENNIAKANMIIERFCL